MALAQERCVHSVLFHTTLRLSNATMNETGTQHVGTASQTDSVLCVLLHGRQVGPQQETFESDIVSQVVRNGYDKIPILPVLPLQVLLRQHRK